MVDIILKKNTLRKATAQAIVRVSSKDTIVAIKNGTVPKGDVFEMSRAAGLLGVKKTAEILPDCHPIPIEFTGFEFEINDREITIRLEDAPNDTSKNYKIKKYKGTFGIISSVTNPFCDRCNRLRLTANGHLKNCLFSSEESDLLSALRNNQDLEPIIGRAVLGKFAVRSGMESPAAFEDVKAHQKNRSMITIGG